MKYALIGYGMICANHTRAALETGLEIVALCDLVEENRDKALAMLPEEKRSGVKLCADYRAMLSEQRPALTAVALGSGIKRQIVCDCLEAGTNVIVKKPITLSLEDADAMISVMEHYDSYDPQTIRNYCRENFSGQGVARQFTGIYESLTAQRKG